MKKSITATTNTAPIDGTAAKVIQTEIAEISKPKTRKQTAASKNEIKRAAIATSESYGSAKRLTNEQKRDREDCAANYGNAHSYGFGDAKYAMVPLRLLRLDSAYQRKVDNSHVNDLVSNWDNNECEHIVVNFRDDGHHIYYYVIDGQHRMEAAKRLGLAAIPCKIYHKLTREQEAMMFAEQGSRTKTVNSFAKFRALFYAGNKTALLVNDACKQYQISTSQKPFGTPGSMGGMTTIMNICEKSGIDMVEQLFKTIEGCGWHAYPGAYSSYILSALRNVYSAEGCNDETMGRIIHKVGVMSPIVTLCEARRLNTDLGPTRALTKYFSE